MYISLIRLIRHIEHIILIGISALYALKIVYGLHYHTVPQGVIMANGLLRQRKTPFGISLTLVRYLTYVEN